MFSLVKKRKSFLLLTNKGLNLKSFESKKLNIPSVLPNPAPPESTNLFSSFSLSYQFKSTSGKFYEFGGKNALSIVTEFFIFW